MQAATRILAVRHGETPWNRDSRIQGHTDIELNERGHWQAERLAQALREEPLVAIHSSDLARARQTALAVARQHGAAVHTHAGLRERGFGAFEGHTWAELEPLHPAGVAAWRRREPDFAPPGGESLRQLRERVLATLADLARPHPGATLLVVAHGGVLDILYRAAAGLDLQAPRHWAMTNTAINRLDWTPAGLQLVQWADTGHLKTDDDSQPLDERAG